MNSRINFLIAAINDNAKYIDFVRHDTDLLNDTKKETIYKISNIILNNALELQTLIVNENETFN